MVTVPAQDEEPGWAEIRPARTIETRAAERKIGAGAPDEPSAGGVIGWTFVVLALIAAVAFAARRLLRRTPLLAADDAIRVVGRRALAPRQELYLVEIGSRMFLIGSTRDRLVALGEFARPEQEFRAALRESLRESETKPASYGAVASELAEIRKTVEGWRA